MTEGHTHDPACALAHGDAPAPGRDGWTLVAVYASPMASFLLHWGRELGFRTVLVEPDPDRVTDALSGSADAVVRDPSEAGVTGDADVVVTDHDRGDLGPVMSPLVRARPRWVGIMGSRRHDPPHVPALRAEGVDEDLIALVQRPIGLDIGSKTPAEIALATLAGLVADRNGKPGGFPAPVAA